MKKVFALFLAGLIVFSMGTAASAATKISSGTSTGGASCTAELHYFNSTEDYAYSETACLEYGRLYAYVKIYFNSSSDSNSNSRSAYDVNSGPAYVDSGTQATKATSSHTYSSDTYGSWSRSISANY